MPEYSNNNESLTEEGVQDVLNAWNFLEFANSYRQSTWNTYFTPDTVNQQMKNINMNPVEATIGGIENALKNPKNSELILRGYAESFELQNMYYKRLLRYIPDMACFNLNFDVINMEKSSEFKSKEFKADLKILDDFCGKFDFKQEFATVIKQMLRQGIFYCVLREDEGRYSLQELPADFCKLTGRWSNGLLFDFNMQWFIGSYGVNINMFPRIFKKMYNNVFTKISNKYNPASNIDVRSSTFVYWHQCSPSDGFWAFKIDPEIATIVPYYSGLFADLSMQPIIRGLQNDRYFIEASKLLVGIIGFNKEAKTGQVSNQLNMTPDMLGKFLGVARQGLQKQIGLVALPVEKIETVEFDTSNTNIYIEHTIGIAKKSVSSADVLFADEKLNSHQSKLASAIDVNFLNSLYPMFARFVEYFVNSRTKKYKFKITFSDVDIPDNRTERENKFKNMAAMGIVDIQQAARIYDITPFEFGRRLSMSDDVFGIKDKLIPLMSLNNQSADGSQGNPPKKIGGKPGRPAAISTDNDNTEASQARGSNELK